MPGATLGIRRLQTPHKDLLPLRHCIDSHVGIIKQRQKHFIDSKGFIFIYEKTKMCEIKYFKIRKVEQKELASLLWLKGVKQPFTIPRPPRLGCSWAGVLHLHGLPWMLYDYAEEEQPLRRRKV